MKNEGNEYYCRINSGIPARKFGYVPRSGVVSDSRFYLGVVQLAERLLWEQEAVGAEPATQTNNEID